MKATKRSLIVSIAILCVCAMSLTAASYAWFSASQTAMVDDLNVQVIAQSDIKIAADSQALSSADSPYWKTTLLMKDITDANPNYPESIHDVTPATEGTCDGSFEEPDTATREKIGDNGVLPADAKIVSASGGWASFTVYIRTTKNDKGVAFSNTAFKVKESITANVANALALGETNTGGIYTNASLASNEVIVKASELQALGSTGYYTGQVTFYVWVEGTHADCKNVNALANMNYNTDISFAYEV